MVNKLKATGLPCPSRQEGPTRKGELTRDFQIFCYKTSISWASKVDLPKTFRSRIVILNFFLCQNVSILLTLGTLISSDVKTVILQLEIGTRDVGTYLGQVS